MVAVVAILAIAIVHIRFQSYVYTSVKAAKKVLFGKEYDALEQFTMPMAIVGEAGDIVWANAAFLESAGRARDCRGENVMKFLYPHTIQQVVAAKGTDVTIGDRQFTAFASKTEQGHILCLVDDTYYKAINREYVEKHPVVALAHLITGRNWRAIPAAARTRALPRRWSRCSPNGRRAWAAFSGGSPAGAF